MLAARRIALVGVCLCRTVSGGAAHAEVVGEAMLGLFAEERDLVHRTVPTLLRRVGGRVSESIGLCWTVRIGCLLVGQVILHVISEVVVSLLPGGVPPGALRASLG